MHEVGNRAAYSTPKQTLEASPKMRNTRDTPLGREYVSANTSTAFATMSTNSPMPTNRAMPLPRRTSSSA